MAVQDRSPEQSADHVLFGLGPRIDVFVHREDASSHVVGDSPQAAAVLIFRTIGQVAGVGGGFDQGPQDVDVVVGFHALHHGGRPLQSHPGVDIAAGQRTQVVRRVAHSVELREHEIPDLDLLAAAGRVVEDLAARAADAVGPIGRGAGRPEIVALLPSARIRSEVRPTSSAQMSGGFVVVEIDGDRQAVGIDAQPFLVRSGTPRPRSIASRLK